MNQFLEATKPEDLPRAAIASAVIHSNAIELIQELKARHGIRNEVRKKVAMAKAVSTSLASIAMQGRLPVPIYEKRKAQCSKCRYMSHRDDGYMKCNQCGCGDWKYAALDSPEGKLWNPATGCPIRNFTVGAYNKGRTKFYEWDIANKQWALVWEFS